MKISRILFTFATIFIVGTFMITPTAAQNVVANPERPPLFSGGPAAMNAFIANTMRYPDDAFERRAQGLVVFTFVVETDGTLSNIRPVRLADPSLDAEALRIIQAMPLWTPAEHRGRAVRAEATVPMFFSISPNATTNAPARQQQRQDYARTDLNILQNNPIYTIVDRMPQFATGPADLANFIARNICYPREALADGIDGRILASFVIAPDGSISNIEIVDGIPALNEEAIRVLSMMPNWRPGERNGVPVHVRVLQEVNFVIDEAPIPTGF